MDLALDQLRGEVYFRNVRSRGPGGQNVNKTSSAAVLFWDFEFSKLLTEFQKNRVRLRLESLLNGEGQISLRSDEFRDLERNKTRCLEKLVEHVAKALHIPKRRKATKPTYGSVQRRIQGKSRRSETKKMRRKVDD